MLFVIVTGFDFELHTTSPQLWPPSCWPRTI